MNHLELNFLSLIQFELQVSEELFFNYYRLLNEHYSKAKTVPVDLSTDVFKMPERNMEVASKSSKRRTRSTRSGVHA
jgi:hypothetical protein